MPMGNEAWSWAKKRGSKDYVRDSNGEIYSDWSDF